jgi:hypothetical protein
MKTRLLPILLLALLLAACGGSGGSRGSAQNIAAPTSAPAATSAPAMPAEAPAGGAAFDSGESTAGEPRPATTDQSSGEQQNLERLVIKNATVALEVESVANAETLVRAKVQELGGYIVQVQTSGTDNSLMSQITFRVPAAQFDNALNGMQGIAHKVLSRQISGDDVTEEYVDLGSRLRNLEATRTRLLDLLQKANRVEDALQVNQALTDVQGQIEQITGRMQYLKQNAALSTINVSLQPIPVTPIIEDDGWQPLRVARLALRDLLGFGQDIAGLLIVLAIWTPVWLPLLLLARFVWRRARRAMDRPIAPARTSAPSDTPPAAS